MKVVGRDGKKRRVDLKGKDGVEKALDEIMEMIRRNGIVCEAHHTAVTCLSRREGGSLLPTNIHLSLYPSTNDWLRSPIVRLTTS